MTSPDAYAPRPDTELLSRSAPGAPDNANRTDLTVSTGTHRGPACVAATAVVGDPAWRPGCATPITPPLLAASSPPLTQARATGAALGGVLTPTSNPAQSDLHNRRSRRAHLTGMTGRLS